MKKSQSEMPDFPPEGECAGREEVDTTPSAPVVHTPEQSESGMEFY